jgi:hypothetical protein
VLVEVNDAVQLQIVHLTLKYAIFKHELFVSNAIGHPLQIDETVEQDKERISVKARTSFVSGSPSMPA